jgi:hypothetical protein
MATRNYEFTSRELERMDFVDNAIYNLLLELAGVNEDKLEWDMEDIGEIRDLIQEIVVNKYHLMTEMEFCPCREWDKNGNLIMEYIYNSEDKNE